MSAKKKILFIVNPISGAKKRTPVEALIEKHLDKVQFDPSIHFTTERGDATIQSKRAVQGGYDVVVAVGGDGTINEVAQGLVNTKVALAVIPRGSGNGFANYFNIPHDPVGAMEVINEAQPRPIDTGTLNGKLFLSVAGLGFDARVATAFDTFGKRGLLSYMYISVKEYFKFKPREYKIQFDGSAITIKAFLLTVANSSQFGNNAFIAPKAIIDDGFLDVVILKPANIFSSLIISLRMFRGTLHKSKYCEVHRAKQIKIVHEDREAQIDGEPISVENESNIKVHPNTLLMIS